MITRIEIEGFKTFQDFSLDLAPFTVIAGANGSGKSNLFDALRLLSSLAEKDLKQAFQEQRGEPHELFTQYGAGKAATRMRFAVELLLNPTVEDDWGQRSDLAHLRMRYELEIERRPDPNNGLDKLYVLRENLRPLKAKEDEWKKHFLAVGSEGWRPRKRSNNFKPYIETREVNGVPALFLRQDGTRGGKPTPARELGRTVLSGVTGADFPHAFAVKQELLGWRQLHLEPSEMRKPASLFNPDQLGDHGEHLTAALQRIESRQPGTLQSISRRLSQFVPSLRRITIDKDEARQQWVLQVQSSEGQRWTSRVLSEGTLRLLVFTALAHDETYSGTLCLEEPENGIHPARIREALDLLRDLSTDLRQPPQEGVLLRQVLVNTHSPVLLKEYFRREAEFQGLCYFAFLSKIVDPKEKVSYRITRMLPVSRQSEQPTLFPHLSPAEIRLTETQVEEFLHAPAGAEFPSA